MKLALRLRKRKNNLNLKKSDTDIEIRVRVLHKKRKDSIRLFDIIITVFGMLSAVMCLITAFKIDVNVYKALATILLTVLISWYMFKVKKGRKVLITIVLILYIFGFVFLLLNCSEQFMVLTNTITEFINKVYYTSFFEFDIRASVKRQTDYTVTFLYIISFLTFVFNIGMNLRYNIAICTIVTLPLAFLGFIFTIMPSTIWFVAYLMFLFVLLVKTGIKTERLAKKSFARRGNEYVLKEDTYYAKDIVKAECILIMIVAIIGITTMLIIPENKYERVSFFEDLRMVVDEEISLIQNKVFGSQTASGGINGGKIGDVSEIKFSENVDLVVELPKTGNNIYLRTYIGSEYTKRGFDELSQEICDEYQTEFEYLWENGFNSLTMTGDILAKLNDSEVFLADGEDAINTCMAKIKIDDASKKYGYIPYNSNYLNSQKNSNKEDGYIGAIASEYKVPMYWVEDKARYQVYSDYGVYEGYVNDYTYFSDVAVRGNTSDEINTYFANERIYRDIVYDIYTRLPKDTNAEIISELSKLKINTNDDVFSLINNLQEYYRENFTYTLSPGVVPNKKDVVEYFLYETKSGYCTYFAAASVVLLRAANIPARYVEGYVVKPSDYIGNVVRIDKDIELYSLKIKDSSAHAWVEVYIDGYGWIVADFTPGYQNSFRATGIVHKDEEEESETYTKEEAKDEDITEEESATNEVVTKEEEQPSKEQEDNTLVKNEDKDTSNTNNNIKKDVIIIIVSMIGIVVLIMIYHVVVIVIRRIILKRADDKKKVKIIYIRIEKMLRTINIRRNTSESYMDFAMRIEKEEIIFKEKEFISCINIMESVIYGNEKLSKKDYKHMVDTLILCEKRLKSNMSKIKLLFYKYILNYIGI